MAGSNAMKSANEKTPSEQHFSIAFEIGSLSDIAWITAKIYFPVCEVDYHLDPETAKIFVVASQSSICLTKRNNAFDCAI
jgi:hypothetical protein